MVYLLNGKTSSQFNLVQFVGYLACWPVIQKIKLCNNNEIIRLEQNLLRNRKT